MIWHYGLVRAIDYWLNLRIPLDLVSSEPLNQSALRHAAVRWLRERTFDGELALTREEILDFTFEGERFRLQDLTKGIRRPAGWSAALSVTTSFKPKRQFEIYDDRLGADGLWHYSWEKGGSQIPTNAGLLTAYQQQLPLIGFLGVGGKPSQFQVLTPIHVVDWLPELQQVVLAPAGHGATLGEQRENNVQMETIFREYITRETKARVHQPFFRQLILRAYEGRCAVCNLGHQELLDAAHIIPDAEGGEPTVTNGLAMCKIHHTAYDRKIIGIDPDYQVHVKPSLLEEHDGPMLEHGLKQMHGRTLMRLPSLRAEHPDRAHLATTFARFSGTRH